MENFLRSKEYWGLVENEISVATEDIVFTYAQKKHVEDQKERFESKELSISSITSFDLGDNPQQGYNKEHMGFYKAEIPKFDTGKACTFASSSE